jgi:hypothetical protein
VGIVPYEYAYSVHKIAPFHHVIGWAQIGFLAIMIAREKAVLFAVPVSGS